MKTMKAIVCSLFCVSVLIAADAVKFNPDRDNNFNARAAIDAWQDWFSVEFSKKEDHAVGLALGEGLVMQANTRRSQLRYFDRKAHQLYWQSTNNIQASNACWWINKWISKPLPDGPE